MTRNVAKRPAKGARGGKHVSLIRSVGREECASDRCVLRYGSSAGRVEADQRASDCRHVAPSNLLTYHEFPATLIAPRRDLIDAR